jgi:hypothetical protein
VLELEAARIRPPCGEAPEHKRVVWIRAMSEANAQCRARLASPRPGCPGSGLD